MEKQRIQRVNICNNFHPFTISLSSYDSSDLETCVTLSCTFVTAITTTVLLVYAHSRQPLQLLMNYLLLVLKILSAPYSLSCSSVSLEEAIQKFSRWRNLDEILSFWGNAVGGLVYFGLQWSWHQISNLVEHGTLLARVSVEAYQQNHSGKVYWCHW